jgi:hypothetical protein
MQISIFCLFLAGSGLLSGQPQPFTPIIRSISVTPISTSQKGLAPVDFETIKTAWTSNQVDLAVEQRLNSRMIEKAERIIQEVYRREGQAVRVEHTVTQISPRSYVALVFQVIELSQCN